MVIKDLKANPRNPRVISNEKLEMLKVSVLRYGDLSGFVENKHTGNMISGHQKQKVIPDNSEIVIEKKYDTPTACRTIAEGYVLIEGERWKYRQVDADETWETEAMLAANRHGGEWDQPMLSKILIETPKINIEFAGFTLPEVSAMNIPGMIDGSNEK